MHVFVYEYLCGGALAEQAGAESLRREGWAMLRAVLDDLGRCPGVRVTTLLDAGLDPGTFVFPDNLAVQCFRPGAEESTFRALARRADYTLVIAPECDELLYQRCRWVEEEKGHLLGPCAEAVRLTGDKLRLAEYLAVRGVSTPPSVSLCDAGFWRAGSVSDRRSRGADIPVCRERGRQECLPHDRSRQAPLVCKPRHGAGSQATFLLRDDEDLDRCVAAARAEGWTGPLIAQPYIPGLAVSVAFLGGPSRLLSLPATEQTLTTDGRFRYQGGRLPLAPMLDQRARTLAEKAVRQVEGMHGYFGVDLVLGPAEDGSGDTVIEINPRLTTSYVGLRALADFNLAEALLATATGAALPELRWHARPVAFTAAGSVHT